MTDWGSQFQSSLLREFTHLLGEKHIYITAYHPCVNRLVEIFHQYLKTSLTTRHDTTNWVDDLPLIVLSSRNTLKEDLGCSATEFVFSTPLSLPGQYFSPTTGPTWITPFIQELCQKMANLTYTPPWHRPTEIYILHQLQDYKFVFVRNDAIKWLLTLTYLGPFQVIDCSDKHLTIKQGDCTDTVSIDHVKPAFLERTHSTVDSATNVQPYTTMPTEKWTSSGWRVIFSKNYKSYVYINCKM